MSLLRVVVVEVMGWVGSSGGGRAAPTTMSADRAHRRLITMGHVEFAIGTPSLLRFNSTLDDLGTPRRDQCQRSWCKYRAVCFSDRDGIIVPNRSSLGNEWRRMFDPVRGWHRGIRSTVLAERATPMDVLSQTSVHMVRGHALVISCWRQRLHRRNPYHLMHGMGWLLQAAMDAGHGRLPRRTIDTIVFHQCPRHADASDWSFWRGIWLILAKLAVDNGLFARALRRINLVTLGVRRQEIHYLRDWLATGLEGSRDVPLGADDTVVCMEHAIVQRRSAGTLLGLQTGENLRVWRRLVAAHAHAHGIAIEPWPSHATSARDASAPPDLVDKTCDGRCSSALRIGVWRRANNSIGGSRNFVNIDAVLRLAAAYTSRPVRVLSSSEGTPFAEQLRLFRSFDLLITPHGSQLTNLILAPPSVLVVEVQPTAYDTNICKSGRQFSAAYLMSYGHLPTQAATDGIDPDLVRLMRGCAADPKAACDRGVMKQRRSFVVLPKLRADLQLAIASRCACSARARANASRAIAARGCPPPTNLARAAPCTRDTLNCTRGLSRLRAWVMTKAASLQSWQSLGGSI